MFTVKVGLLMLTWHKQKLLCSGKEQNYLILRNGFMIITSRGGKKLELFRHDLEF